MKAKMIQKVQANRQKKSKQNKIYLSSFSRTSLGSTDDGVHIQLFRERLSEKLCTRQSRKVIWDMINTLFLTTVAVKTNLFTFLWHSRTYVRGLPCQISSNFFEEQGTQNYPQYLSGLSRALFPTTFLEIPVCKNLLGHIWQNEQRDLCCCCCFYFQTFRVLFSSYLTLCYLWEGLLHTCYVM